MKLKTLITALVAVITISNIAYAAHSTRGYMRKNGTYVAPHMSASPNSSKYDNYSTKGNTNPYTGKAGYVNPYKNTPRPYRPKK